MNFPDFMIHFRLCEFRLINFIMTIFSIAYQVHHNIFFKLLSIGYTKLHYSVNVFNVFRIDMNNGSIKRFCDIRAVFWWTRVNWPCCISYLVVSYEMYCPFNLEFWHLTQTKCLINYSLSRNCWISMNLNIQNLLFFIVNLFWPGFSHWYWVLGF